jgi:hypothetical protein
MIQAHHNIEDNLLKTPSIHLNGPNDDLAI